MRCIFTPSFRSLATNHIEHKCVETYITISEKYSDSMIIIFSNSKAIFRGFRFVEKKFWILKLQFP
jgi:hypothetical protein